MSLMPYLLLLFTLLLLASASRATEVPAIEIAAPTNVAVSAAEEEEDETENDEDKEDTDDEESETEENDSDEDDEDEQEDSESSEDDTEDESKNESEQDNNPIAISQETDKDDDDESEPRKLIETSASINFSYSVPIDNDDPDSNKETDLSGSLDISLNPSDHLSFHTSIGKRFETELEVDEAYVDWIVRDDDQTISLRAGKKFAPFGQFSSTMINSSLPTQLGETDPDAIIEGELELDQTSFQAYVFKGQSAQIDSDEKHELAYGANINYETDMASVGVGYLSNLAESDFFSPNDVAKKIPAAVIHAEVNAGRFTVIGEHLAATKNFVEDDLDETITEAAQPSASQLEVNFTFDNQGTLGLAWNNTKEAEEIDLPKETIGLAYSYPIRENLTGTIELSQSKDYDQTKSKEVIVELSQEFY